MKVLVIPFNPMYHSLSGSSVNGILQARVLAIPFSRGSSQPRVQTQVSCTAGGFFIVWATRKVQVWVIYRGSWASPTALQTTQTTSDFNESESSVALVKVATYPRGTITVASSKLQLNHSCSWLVHYKQHTEQRKLELAGIFKITRRMTGVLTFKCQVPYWVFFLIWALPSPNAMTFWIIAGPRAGRVTVNKAVGYLYAKNGYRLFPINLLQGFPHFWSGLCSVTLCTFCKDKSVLHQLPEWILGTFSLGKFGICNFPGNFPYLNNLSENRSKHTAWCSGGGVTSLGYTSSVVSQGVCTPEAHTPVFSCCRVGLGLTDKSTDIKSWAEVTPPLRSLNRSSITSQL